MIAEHLTAPDVDALLDPAGYLGSARGVRGPGARAPRRRPHDRRRPLRRRGTGRRAARRAVNSLGTDLGMWDDQAGPLSRAPPPDPLRPARPRRVAGPAGARTRRRSRRRPDRPARPARDRARLAVRAVARRHDRDVGGERSRPSAIERLVLCCTSALLGCRRADLAAAGAHRARPGRRGDRRRASLERWFTPEFLARPIRRRSTGSTPMLRATPAEGYAGCCEAIRDMDLSDRLGADHGPDARDRRRRGPGDAARCTARASPTRIPGARLEVLRRGPPGQRRAAPRPSRAGSSAHCGTR